MEEFTYNWEGEILTEEFLAAFPVGDDPDAAVDFIIDLYMSGPRPRDTTTIRRMRAWAASLPR